MMMVVTGDVGVRLEGNDNDEGGEGGEGGEG